MTSLLKIALMGCLLVVFSGCSTPPKRHDVSYAPAVPLIKARPPVTNGSLFQAGFSGSLFSSVGSRQIGDIITVQLDESMKADKRARTNTNKNSSLDAIPDVFFAPMAGLGAALRGRSGLLNGPLDTASTFNGDGRSSQENSVSGDVTVTIIEVFPNGNLMVRGEKLITINQGEETIRFSGIVRPQDINENNVVQSSRVADARIIYTGAGLLADANTSGWLGRIFQSAYWPF